MVRHRFNCQSDRLGKLLAGGLSRHEELELDAHLGDCPACREALESLAADRAWWADLPRLGDRDPDDDAATLVAEDDRTLGILEPSDSPGSLGRLGHYEVAGVLGRGGMGVVLRAFDPTLHRPVAIKVIAPQLATSAAARRRFAREARAAAAVSHDHVVAIHAVAESRDGLPYLVMPYIPGRSLQERIDENGPLSVAEILRIGTQTAAGLAAAHAQGLVHRDVKPANILLENGVERVRITDFGLARVADDVNATHSGFVAGTPQYMAPEQANGESVDARADLFSLGSVMYAMATGHSPFRAATNMAVLKRVCESAPRPIRELNPEVPTWLAAIITRLLAKDPADRFESAAEVAELLARCLAYLERPDGSSVPYHPGRDRKAGRRRLLWRVSATLAAAVVGLGVARWAGPGPVSNLLATVLRIKSPVGTLLIEVDDPEMAVRLDNQDLVFTGPGVKEFRVKAGTHRVTASKDGKRVHDELITIARDTKRTLVIRRESADEVGESVPAPRDADARVEVPHDTPVRGTGPNNAFAFAMARNRLEEPGLPLARILQPVSLYDHSPAAQWPGHAVSFMAYSGDGKLLAIATNVNQRILLFELPSRRLKMALSGPSARVNQLAFSPDGTNLAAATGHPGSPVWSGEVWLWDLTQKEDAGVCVASDLPIVLTLAFSRDGKTLAYAGTETTISLYDLRRRTVRAVCQGHMQKVRSVAFSPNGALLASGASDRTVRLWDAETGKPAGAPFPSPNGDVATVAFSPDGSLLAACSTSQAASQSGSAAPAQISVWEVSNRRERASLSGHPNQVLHMAFSPDGKTLATAGGLHNGSGEVILWDVARWQRLQTLRVFSSAVECVAYAPDSMSLIAATTHPDTDSEVRVFDLSPASAVVQEFQVNGDTRSRKVTSLAFAPDGNTLAAATGDELSYGGVWLWDVASRTGRVAAHTRLGIHALAYAPAGDRIALGTFDGLVDVYDAAFREPRSLKGRQVSVNALAFSPDGALLATSGRDATVRLWELKSGRELHRTTLKQDEAWSLAFRPDGKTIAVGLKSGTIVLFDVASWVAQVRLPVHRLGVSGLAFTRDGATLVSGSWDRTVSLWDGSSGDHLATLVGHQRAVTSLAVSPDGRWAASGESGDVAMSRAKLLIWDLAERRLHAKLPGHADAIRSVAFSPDGKTVASACEAGLIKLWEIVRSNPSDR